MINANTLKNDALSLGLTVSTGDNRVRISGRIGAVKKAFAMQGLSAERAANGTGWYMLEDDGTPAASVCIDPSGGEDFAYAFTFNGGSFPQAYVG